LRERQRQVVEALQPERKHAGEESGQQGGGDPPLGASRQRPHLRQQGNEARAADADEKSEIDQEPRRPDRRRDRGIGFGRRVRRAGARRAHGEQHRAADRMTVRRDHPPAQHIAAAPQPRRRDRDCAVLGLDRRRQQLAGRSDQAHHQRRYRLVEAQFQGGGRIRERNAVDGL
jgi:hypothetical protein